MKSVLLSSLLVLAAASAGLAQETITGRPRVVDSDVLDFDGQRVMLYGLESVERGQLCEIDGKIWECYPAAVRQLETLSDIGEVTCEQVEIDMFRRWLAYCTVGGEDLGEAFVASGFAVARPDETDRFVAAETAAAAAKAGLWQGKFQRPAEYREAAGIMVDRP